MNATGNNLNRPGATVTNDGVRFRVWAPERGALELVLVDSGGTPQRAIPLSRDGNADSYFSLVTDEVPAGAHYLYRLDREEQLFPDPASNFQPFGVFGPSQVVDHRQFPWTDQNWRGVQIPGQVLYEMHIGSFTPAGTWRAAVEKLPHLRDVGITVVQIMPVAAFPGKFGWGYDGVYWYAPTKQYGTPDDFRTFVDHAHTVGIAVILDVVYNHFGPAGNFTAQFSRHYESSKHHTEWGGAINFDSAHAGPVRDFVAQNAAYWVREFHVDGLRLDAVQAVVDDSPTHIVAQLTRAARNAAGNRSIMIISEDEKNRCWQVLAEEHGGWGTDGILNDDFHHSCRVAATGNNEAYYRDYTGSAQELANSIRFGHLYQGQWNIRQGRHRGYPARNVAAPNLVHFLQNHDQVANSARGLRTHLLTSPGRHRALTALLLLGPATPLIFMGQEFGASNPFLYFADHDEELAELVHKGRTEFMFQFPRIKSLDQVTGIFDPADERTFQMCKLNWAECESNEPMVRLHRDLIRLRKQDAVFARQDRAGIESSLIGQEAFALRWYGDDGDDRLGLFNLGRDYDWHPITDPLVAPPLGKKWKLIWSSEDPRYDGLGTPAFDNKNWPVPGHAAVIFATINQ